MSILASVTVALPDWMSICLFGGLIFSLASLTSAGAKLLSGSLGVYLGEVSFAIYMICIPWQLVFERASQRLFGYGEFLPPWLWAIELLGVIPAAMVLHHLVERPARLAMRKHGAPFLRARNTLRERIAALTAD